MHRRQILLPALILITLVGNPAPAGAQAPHEAAIREFRDLVLQQVGPQGQAERNQKVADWMQKVEGLDLGEYGFLRHIALYFGREYDAAADGLSSYLEEVGGFPTNEYDTIIGRIFLNALSGATRSGGWERFDHFLELALAFYPDVRTLYRAAGSACRSSGTLEALRRLEEITTLLVHDDRLDDAGRQTVLEGIYRAPRSGPAFKTFRTLDMDGVSVSPEDYRGGVVLIDYWATWCVPCMDEMPNVVAVYDRYHDQGFEIIGVSLDKEDAADTIRATMAEQGMKWRQVYDGKYWEAELARLNNIQSIPATFLIDRKGVVRYRNLRGAELERRVRELVAEPPE